MCINIMKKHGQTVMESSKPLPMQLLHHLVAEDLLSCLAGKVKFLPLLSREKNSDFHGQKNCQGKVEAFVLVCNEFDFQSNKVILKKTFVVIHTLLLNV